MSEYWSKLRCLKGGWVTLSANFRGKGVVHNEFWRQKTSVPGLSRGVVCVILRLSVLIQYRRVTHTHTPTHRHTDRQTHDDGYYRRRASSVRVKTCHTAPTPASHCSKQRLLRRRLRGCDWRWRSISVPAFQITN